MSFPRPATALAAIAVVLAIGFAFFAPLVWSSRLGGQFADGAIYLFMADVFSPWRAAPAVAFDFFAEARFPPLYPAWLGALGAASFDLPVAHRIQLATMLLACALGAAYAIVRTRSTAIAVAVALAMLFSPSGVRAATDLASEPLFVAILMLVLLAVERREPAPAGAADALPGVLAALLILTREIGVAALPALALWSARRRSPWGFAGIAFAAATLLAWHWLRAHYAQFGSYGHVVVALVGDDAMGYVRALPARAARVWVEAWGDAASFSRRGATAILAGALFLAALPALARELARARVLGWFVATYLAIVLVWPYPEEAPRFMMPLIAPVAILAALTIASRARDPRLLAAAAILVAMPLLPELPRLLERARLAVPEEQRPYVGSAALFRASDADDARYGVAFRTKFDALVRRIPERIAPAARLCATPAELVSLRAQRTTRRVPLGMDEEVGRRWLRENCDYVVVARFDSPAQGLSMLYPAQLLPQPIHPVDQEIYDGGDAENPHPSMIAALIALQDARDRGAEP